MEQSRSPGTTATQPIRVLLAKVGLDGHDRGVRVVARTLRDAGMDVIYSGLHRTPEEVVNAAVQEDVDILGVSLLSGVQLTVFPKIIKLLAEKGVTDMILVAGGVMPDEDVVELKRIGVHEVMLQDTPPEAIVAALTRLVNERGER
jgi:methylmalonyl-CoA mutase C-terminal domain/subunit